MPHLVQMDKRYGDKGLKIIGAEMQRSPKEKVQKIADKFKVKFPLTQGIQGPSTGSGIPRAVVFDPAGKVIFSGHPADDQFKRTVKKALRELKKLSGSGERKSNLPEVSKPLIEQRSWTNDEGQPLVAAVLSMTASEVEFKLSNGKKVQYPISKLSEEDQNLIKEAASKKESGE